MASKSANRPAPASEDRAVDPGAFVDDVVRFETRLYNAIGERLKADHGIPPAQFEALQFIHGHAGCRVGDLARAFAAGIGASSKIVARLEQRGLVRRSPDPADGRSSLIDLTAAGRALLDEARPSYRAAIDDLLGGTLDTERGRIAAAVMRQLRDELERRNVGLPAG